MNQMLTRHIINPELIIHQINWNTNKELLVDYEKFCSMIDYWKILLVEKYQAKPGKTILIEFNLLTVYYYSAIFAASELGLIMVIDWPHAYNEYDVHSYRMTMHGKIDYAIVHSSQLDPNSELYSYWDVQRNTINCNQLITEIDFDTYEIKDHDLYKQVAKTIFANPTMPVIWSASSGTTGLPKKIEITHQEIYLQAQRLSIHSNYQPTDSCLHMRNLHHGASMCYHFLPSFMVGKDQYLLAYKDQIDEQVTQTVIDFKINKILLYTANQVSDYLKLTPPLEHHLDIITLFLCPVETVALLKEKNVSSLRTMFGDTTIGLGFFVKTVYKDFDKNTYEKNCLGKQLDDFFNLKIEDGLLYISCPATGKGWKTSKDRFELRNDQYYFFGRSDLYRIKDEWVGLADIESKIAEYFGNDGATVAFDTDGIQTKILLVVWKENAKAEQNLNDYFESNFKEARINNIARNLNPAEFTISRKIDREKIRDYFRRQS